MWLKTVWIKFMLVPVILLLAIVHLDAHEPLFGLGPHTIYQNGVGLESALEKGESGWANHWELLYGITPDWAVTFAAPYLFTSQGHTAGFGDISLRSKLRFFRRDMPGASLQAAFHSGVRFPTGDRILNRGSGATDYFLGASLGYESRRHYFFAGSHYQINRAVNGLERGNRLEFDLAYGIRPYKLEYLQPDPVLLVEFIGETIGKDRQNGVSNANSGGSVLSVAPGLLFSYRNVMLKAGVKIPIINDLNGVQETPDPEYVMGLEFHLPPLF